ncbi:LOW QUALITY PROTEIN: hypothetical protein PHMEG_00014971 [Phytophthora megakarya]|uniref:Peptidase A2 domain-containing protein n=1 Tax=Phytophthora megakarya TaxID=4795 RepID=A0A225W414_9STRA|nr:LOW QUALITY PROTEIN: hypothetical protein PHMEG_00014971 [Phytophthora megakarya]
MEEFYNQIRKWYDPTRHAGLFPEQVEKIYCIYAYVNKATADRGRKESELRGNTCNLHSYTARIASLPRNGEFSRSGVALDHNRRESQSRGYWKRHTPVQWFRQAKISGRINQERAILLLETGADVSIMDTTFARGINAWESVTTCIPQKGEPGSRSRYRDIWCIFYIRIKYLSGQNAILGIYFMVPAGVRMDLADGSIRLPDEVGIPLNGHKRLYNDKMRSVALERNLRIPVGQSEETAARIKLSATEKLWVTRGERWVPTVAKGPRWIRYLVISNIGETILRLDHRLDVGMILDQDKVPRSPGFVSVGSHRYREWQNVALKSTVDTRSEPPEATEGPEEPVVQRPTYLIPRSLLRRAETADINRDHRGKASQSEKCHPPTPPTNLNAGRSRCGNAGRGRISESMSDQAPDRTGTKDIEPKTENPNCQTGTKPESGEDYGVNTRIHQTEGAELHDSSAEGAAATLPQDTEDDDEIYYHESGDLSAEDLAVNLAVLPEIPIATTAKVSIEDLQVGDSGSATPEGIEKLRQIIWKKQHLLVGKGNAQPPAARGAVCDIDVGNAKPIAVQSRKYPHRSEKKSQA